MLVNLDKKDLTLEQSGLVNNFVTLDGVSSPKTCNTLKFEGFSGFNSKYVIPLFEMFIKQSMSNTDIYKAMKVIGNLHNDKIMHEAEFHIIKNVRDSMFLFKTLKSFGVSLPDLRIGYEVYHEHEILYLDKKIVRILKSLSDLTKQDLVFYFYCLAKFLKVINFVNPTLTMNESNIAIAEIELNELYDRYSIPDTIMVDCISLSEDVCFEEINYFNNKFTNPLKLSYTYKMVSTFVYNTFKTKDSELLCIINTTLKEYYVININTVTVYTNNELKEYNTFDSMEWIPRLVANIYNVYSGFGWYKVKYLPLEKLLSSKESELIISNDASSFEKLLEEYPDLTENTNMKYYEGYFKGCTIKNDCETATLRSLYDSDSYAQELYKQVQPYYEHFDLKELTGIVKGVVKGDIFSMLFEGESGTGKSTAARVIADRCGLPFVAINCSTNIEESDIFGTMIPNPVKSSADDPEFIWQDGPLTKAIRYGYVGIIEELGFGRPGVLGKINSLLDESRQIDLPNGEVLKAHPNFRLIATTNIGYEGTNRLNKALVNRFEICKKFTDLNEAEAKDVIMSRTGYSDINKITKVFDVYRAIKKYSTEQNLGLVISIRQLLNIFKQGKYYKNAKDAINNLLLNQAFLEEPDHLKYFTDTVFNLFDLSFKL